jgi:hypothetical protein
MGKQKGRFRKGKYVPTVNVHIKAKHDKAGPHLDLTIRLDEDNVRNTLVPQIKRFLEELDKKKGAKQAMD